METRLIKDCAGFASLEPVWDRLVAESVANACHSTFEWLFTWWQHFGADRRLLLLVAYEHGMAVGLAPVYADACADGFRNLHFIGQGLSDYADFIAPRDRPDVAEALISALLGLRSSWDGMDLEEIPAQSPNKALLDLAIGAGGVPAVWQATVRCPYLPIEGSWGAFYATMGKGFRHEVRNKLNRWNNLNRGRGDWLELRYVDRREVDSVFVDEVVALSDKRWLADGHRSPFLNHPDQEFLREVLPLMGRRNQLRVGELRSGNALLAFMLAYHWQGVVYAWNTQYDPVYAEYSLGRIALVSLAEQSFREGCHELDFMRGEEPYKFQWTTLCRTNLALRTERTAQPAGEPEMPRGRGAFQAAQGERST
ncbi:MAG: GNAT family N-acetyltransferase [Caldiserica bacterium]|nr:GNAT family N-acetyltransferase [Caldisericota bacterium]